MYCSLYLHCCGWWWCFSLAFVDEKKMPLSRLRPLFLPLTSMMIHHPSLSQHEFHGHYGWIRMDIYCSLSILNFPAKNNVLENGFGYIRKLRNILRIHFWNIWIFFDIFEYFWIFLDTLDTYKNFPWYLNFYVFKKDSYQTEDPPYLSLIGTQGNLRNAQLSPFVTTKTGPIGIHWKGTRIKKELLKGSLLTYLTFRSSIFSFF